MKILRLYALNFKRLRFDKPLELREGVTLISGLNEAGKSSILDAILYALFGRVVRPAKPRNEDLIAYGSNEAIVWLEFEVEGRRFQVERRIHRTKPSRAHLYEVLPDGQPKPVATEARKVTETVVRLMGGITFDEIVSSNVVAQKDLGRLIQQKGSDRKRAINAFLNLESFNTVIDQLNEERKELEGTGLARPGRLNIEKARLEALQRELQEIRRKEEEIAKLTIENTHLTTVLKDLEKKYEEIGQLHQTLAEYDETLRKRSEIENQIKHRHQTITEHEEQVAGLENKILEIRMQLKAYEGIELEESILKRAAEKISEIRDLKTRLEVLQRRKAALENEVAVLKGNLKGLTPHELENKLEGLKRSRRRTKPLVTMSVVTFGLAALAALASPSITILPLILVALGVVLLTILTIHLNRLNRIDELIDTFQLLRAKYGELRELESQVEHLSQQRSEAEAQIRSISREVSRYAHIYQKYGDAPIKAVETMLAELQKDLKKRDELNAKANSLSAERQRIKERVDVSALKREIQDLETRLSLLTLPNLPEGVRFSEELLKEKAEEKERLAREIAATRTRIEKNLEVIEQDSEFLREHADIEKKVEEQSRVVQDIERKIRILRKAIEAIELTAESLRSRVKPAVESYMGHILPAITSGRYKAVRLDEDYNLEVWDPDAGEFRPKEIFSGGTEDQFLLAMRLAFALALLPEVKGKKPEFLFLDEPLGSSDEIRRSGILEYLRSGLGGTFKQVFLISHLTGLEEMVDNIVRLENGTPI